MVTLMSTNPAAAAAGVTHVIEVALTTTTLVAAIPLNLTDGTVPSGLLRKFDPVIVTAVPPAMRPEFGSHFVTIGPVVYPTSGGPMRGVPGRRSGGPGML